MAAELDTEVLSSVSLHSTAEIHPVEREHTCWVYWAWDRALLALSTTPMNGQCDELGDFKLKHTSGNARYWSVCNRFWLETGRNITSRYEPGNVIPWSQELLVARRQRQAEITQKGLRQHTDHPGGHCWMPSVSFPDNVSWNHLPNKALVSGHLEDSDSIVTMTEGPSKVWGMQDMTSLWSLET